MVFAGEKEGVLAIVADLKLRGDKYMHEALEEMVLWESGAEAYFALEFGGWKWYESSPDIQAFEAIWSTFREMCESSEVDHKLNGAFVRVGEDDDDVERRYFGNDPYDLVRADVSIEGVDIPSKEEDVRNK